MNIREGIRRVFIAFGGFAALSAFLIGIRNVPTEGDEIRFWSESFKSSAKYDVDSTGKTEIEWPAIAYDEAFLIAACKSVETPRAKEACEGFKSSFGSLRTRQAQTIGVSLLASVLAFASVYLLWRLLDWILAGFQRQSVPQRPS